MPFYTFGSLVCLAIQWSVSISADPVKRLIFEHDKPGCTHPPHPVGGHYTCPKSRHEQGQVCHLTCKDGYTLVGSSTITCLGSRWAVASGSCSNNTKVKACPSPPNVANGVYSCPSGSLTYKLNDVCHLQCNPGYKPSTKVSDITCMSTGGWSSSSSCHEMHCPAPPRVTNGNYTCASSTTHKLNDVCHLQCLSGYKPSRTTSNIKCLPSERWSTPADCEEMTCTTPPNVTNGRFFCDPSGSFKQDDICDLQCDSGFKPSTHIVHAQCLPTGQWSSSASCVEIVCPDPKPKANGRLVCYNPPPFKQNDVCQLHCDHGYSSSSNKVASVCLSSSAWSATASCIEIKCYAPHIVSHGHYKCGNSTSYKIDTVCSLQCDQGYKASSHSDISCVDEDHWSVAGTCDLS